MIPDALLTTILLESKKVGRRIALVLPPNGLNTGIWLDPSDKELLKQHKVFVISNKEEDCYRAAGAEFTDVYFYDVAMNEHVVFYMQTRLRRAENGLLAMHFYYPYRRM